MTFLRSLSWPLDKIPPIRLPLFTLANAEPERSRTHDRTGHRRLRLVSAGWHSFSSSIHARLMPDAALLASAQPAKTNNKKKEAP